MDDVTWNGVVGETASSAQILRAGIIAGLVAGIVAWIYEFVVYAGVLDLMSVYAIVHRGSVIAFGPGVEALGYGADLIGAGVHFVTSCLWGILFAAIWPSLRRRGVEASLAGVVFGLIACAVMAFLLMNVSPLRLRGTRELILLSVIFHTLPFGLTLALTTKYLLRDISSR